MTIKRKLSLLILISTLALVTIGIGGMVVQNRLAATILNLQTSDIPSIEVLTSIRADVLRERSAVLEHLMSTPDEQAKLEQDIQGFEQRIQQHLNDYEKLLNDSEDKRLLDADRVRFAEYVAARSITLKESREGHHDAAEAARKAAKPKVLAITNAIDDHLAYNDRFIATEEKASFHLIANAKVLSWVLISVALIGMLTFGYFLYRSVIGSLSQMQRDIGSIAKTLDFTIRSQTLSKDEVGDTVRAFNQLLDQLQESFKALFGYAQEVSAAANDLAGSAKEVSLAAAAQNDASSNVAATIEELTVSINHVGDRATATNEQTAHSGNLARDGRTVIDHSVSDVRSIATTVREASESLNELEQHTRQITSSVSIIKDVADQTNLLALNAAIEAARAGEQGRGFAVVADEVRKLAERTTSMTVEIDSLTNAISSSASKTAEVMSATVTLVDSSVQRADSASTVIGEIQFASDSAVSMVGEITEAIREQGIAGNQIAEQVERIAQMAEQSSAAAHGTAETALRLDHSAKNMLDVIAKFTI